MRPLILHLADTAMVEGFNAFFSRDDWHFALRCARFEFVPDSTRDILKVPGENDPAVWKWAHAFLKPFRATHAHALVVLDETFDPSPGAERIQSDLIESLTQSGWDRSRFEVIVIRPLLEAWLWMESDHVAQAFGCDSYAALREQLIRDGLWAVDSPKPFALKDARHRAARLGKTKSGRVAFRRVFSAVSSRALDRCQEPGFQLLRRTLRQWFPPDEALAGR